MGWGKKKKCVHIHHPIDEREEGEEKREMKRGRREKGDEKERRKGEKKRRGRRKGEKERKREKRQTDTKERERWIISHVQYKSWSGIRDHAAMASAGTVDRTEKKGGDRPQATTGHHG
jgi:hypothetical protein